MGSFSDYTENMVLDHITGKTSFTKPTVYIALATAEITDSTTGTTITEPSGNGYARKSTSGSDWNAASGGSVSNANTITFTQASGSWGTVTYFALIDASSTGNILAWGQLSASKTISNTDTVSFAAGQLVITLG